MLLFNTLGRKKEKFIPAHPQQVGLYACGITSYDYSHIGHGRSAVVFDVLVRYLKYLGYNVSFVRNFTDVDDKIIRRAQEEGDKHKSIQERCTEISEKYIKAFHEDMDKLGVARADIEPKATENIAEMIEICQKLISKGFAYASKSGDVYFRVRADEDYGKLSGRNLDEMRAGARVALGEEKEDPLDFTLWKSAKEGEPSWDSPWGLGRPGWHIECSAMTEKYLPLPIDIHGGGQDLIFPHHENEIAQSESSTGKEFARYWVHNGFVQINKEKMSKSLGNFTTLREIYKTRLAHVLRYFLLSRHYRSPIDYSIDALDELERSCKRNYEALLQLDEFLKKGQKGKDTSALATSYSEEFTDLCKQWDAAMDDDMNTAAAIGYMNKIFSLLNRIFADKATMKKSLVYDFLASVQEAIKKMADVLGVFNLDAKTFLQELRDMKASRSQVDTSKIEGLLQEREKARAAKDFVRSDAIRDELNQLGIAIRDTPDKVEWDFI